MFERNEMYRSLPQYARDQLDQSRAKAIQNAIENPALMAKLDGIEAKLDQIFALLVAKAPA